MSSISKRHPLDNYSSTFVTRQLFDIYRLLLRLLLYNIFSSCLEYPDATQSLDENSIPKAKVCEGAPEENICLHLSILQI